MGEPIEIEGWRIEGETARIRADRYTADGLHLMMEDSEGHEMDSLHVPEAVVAELLRARGFLVLPLAPELAAKVARAAEVVGESVADFCQAAIAARVMAVADGREGQR